MERGTVRYFLFQTFPRLVGNLLLLISLGISFWLYVRAATCSAPALAVGFLMLGLACSGIGAILLVRLHLPALAAKITFGLLYPRRYLKKPPVMLSPVRGLIASGQLEAAGTRLAELRREYPEDAGIALLSLELYCGPLDRPEAAVSAVETFFAAGPERSGEDYFRLLLRYADLRPVSGDAPAWNVRLEKELKKARLSPRQAAAVRARISIGSEYFSERSSS